MDISKTGAQNGDFAKEILANFEVLKSFRPKVATATGLTSDYHK